MTVAIAILIPVLAVLLSGILLMRLRKRSLAAFNVAVTNKITGRFADRLPGFGISLLTSRLAGGVTSSLRQLSCTILPGSDSRFPCA